MSECNAKINTDDRKPCPHYPDEDGLTSYDNWDEHIQTCILHDGQWVRPNLHPPTECDGAAHDSFDYERHGSEAITWYDDAPGAVPETSSSQIRRLAIQLHDEHCFEGCKHNVVNHPAWLGWAEAVVRDAKDSRESPSIS